MKKSPESTLTQSIAKQDEKTGGKDAVTREDERDFVIPRRNVNAGSPPNYSVSGEEDPGAGLEFIVRKEE